MHKKHIFWVLLKFHQGQKSFQSYECFVSELHRQSNNYITAVPMYIYDVFAGSISLSPPPHPDLKSEEDYNILVNYSELWVIY